MSQKTKQKQNKKIQEGGETITIHRRVESSEERVNSTSTEARGWFSCGGKGKGSKEGERTCIK